MLPLVLGGIALAAVGYGVKEFCESEGCPSDENDTSSRPSPNERFDSFQKSRVALHGEELQRLRVLLMKVTHTDEKYVLDDAVSFQKEKLKEGVLYEDVELYMGMCKASIAKATRLADDYIVNIETMLYFSCDYADYGKPEKKIIKKAYKLINATQKLLVLPLLDKDDRLNIDIIKPLKAYEYFLEKYKVHSATSPFSLMSHNALLK